MLEELIKSLDTKGLLVLQILIGKRAIELLEDKDTTSVSPLSRPKILTGVSNTYASNT